MALVAVASVAVLVPTVIGFVNRVDDLTRVDVPGQTTVTLDAGDFVVYAEYPGAGCTGTRRDADGNIDGCAEVAMPAFDVRVSDAREQTVPIGPYDSTVTYRFSDHDGRAIGTIHIPADGPYTITSTGQPLTLAIGPSIAQGIVALVLSILGIVVSFIALVVTAIVMIVRRLVRR